MGSFHGKMPLYMAMIFVKFNILQEGTVLDTEM